MYFLSEPSFPDFDRFCEEIKSIWDTKRLTNNGPYKKELEKKLLKLLKIDSISISSNGTIALMIALKALNITDEVITTPYSFIATSSALLWSNIKPIYVDIEKDSFNIDASKIEEKITNNTKAILATHCYGFPCEVDKINLIAKKYNLKVIYDAAHCFGVEKHNKSILNNGDISILSFHATKVFNTMEGGALICNNKRLLNKINLLKNFGFSGEDSIDEIGINGKITEMQSIFGLLLLDRIEEAIELRKNIYDFYITELRDIKGIKIRSISKNLKYNYSYMPIIIDDSFGISRDALYNYLSHRDIYVRKYFYPIIPETSVLKDMSVFDSYELENAKDISQRILCLPIHEGITKEIQLKIIKSIRNSVKKYKKY